MTSAPARIIRLIWIEPSPKEAWIAFTLFSCDVQHCAQGKTERRVNVCGEK
jgi:hypothetical protein